MGRYGDWAPSCWLDGYLLEHSGPAHQRRRRHCTGARTDATGPRTGITRGVLYKALCEQGNPSFATFVKVIHAQGLQFNVGHGRRRVERPNRAVALMEYAQTAMKSVASNRVMRCYTQILGQIHIEANVFGHCHADKRRGEG